jgi:hypothetical protein
MPGQLCTSGGGIRRSNSGGGVLVPTGGAGSCGCGGCNCSDGVTTSQKSSMFFSATGIALPPASAAAGFTIADLVWSGTISIEPGIGTGTTVPCVFQIEVSLRIVSPFPGYSEIGLGITISPGAFIAFNSLVRNNPLNPWAIVDGLFANVMPAVPLCLSSVAFTINGTGNGGMAITSP